LTAVAKNCPECRRKLPAAAFYPEPNDEITGLSKVCIECFEAKRAKAKRGRSIKGMTVVSPSGLIGTVVNIREDSSEIAVRFKGTRTVVLPMIEVES
jgi:hypothetical protein